MKFTDEQIRILNKNKSYYDRLKSNGALSKISSVIIQEFGKLYKEVYNREVVLYCMACVVEIIEILYLDFANYEQKSNQPRQTVKIEAPTPAKVKRPKPPGK